VFPTNMVRAAMIQIMASTDSGSRPESFQPTVATMKMSARKPAVLGTKASIALTELAAPW